MEFVVGIGEIAVSQTDDDLIRTFSLASCLGVVMYAPRIKTMAMAHMLLPNSPKHGGDVDQKPARYVDKGMDSMVNLFKHKLGIDGKELEVSVFGGAEAGICSHYNVSEQNIEAVKAALNKYGMRAVRMETGGNYARTITGYSNDGHIQVTPVLMGMNEHEVKGRACV